MFGYIKTDDPYLYKKDDVLYKSLYCGVCKAIGSSCSQAARFSLTYDIAFLSAVAHNVMNKDVTIEKKRCVAHPIVKRPIAKSDELTGKLACINTLLAYYKVMDDVYDNGKGKFKRLVVLSGFKKARKKYPEIDKIISSRYAELNALEKCGEKSVDMVADPFSLMLADISDETLGEYKTIETRRLFYAVGKWIYLIDALDDYAKDVKSGNYNPFYYAYGRKPNAKELLAASGNDIAFLFSDIFVNLEKSVKACDWKFNHDLIDNILLKGIPKTTLSVMNRIKKEKRKKTRKGPGEK